jgi:Protein of unknown function (DUF2950)
MKNGNISRAAALRVAALSAAFALLAASSTSAQTSGQKTFSSSKEAVETFAKAVESANTTDLQAILGAGSESIVSSGDSVADNKERETFVARYRVKHSLVDDGDHQFTLNVGSDNWPLPIPLVDNSGVWYFDGAAGKEEIAYRRIGHNELSAIKVCKGVVAAQSDYAATAHDGIPAGAYATRIVSEPGKQNGLYWEDPSGQSPSPAGPMLAEASQEGYDTSGKPTPYHGYYYRMLKNPGGFALLAYPAQYRSSGVMTFVVTQSGVIHEKDLGANTDEVAPKMSDYQTDTTWRKVK